MMTLWRVVEPMRDFERLLQTGNTVVSAPQFAGVGRAVLFLGVALVGTWWLLTATQTSPPSARPLPQRTRAPLTRPLLSARPQTRPAIDEEGEELATVEAPSTAGASLEAKTPLTYPPATTPEPVIAQAPVAAQASTVQTQPAQLPVIPPVPRAPSLELVSVASNGATRLAVIRVGGSQVQTVAGGDRVADWQVKQIGEGEVVLQQGQKRLTLNFVYRPGESPPVQTPGAGLENRRPRPGATNSNSFVPSGADNPQPVPPQPPAPQQEEEPAPAPPEGQEPAAQTDGSTPNLEGQPPPQNNQNNNNPENNPSPTGQSDQNPNNNNNQDTER